MVKKHLTKTRHIVYVNTFWTVILMTLLALSRVLSPHTVVPVFTVVGIVMVLCNALAWMSFFHSKEKKERMTVLLLAFNTLGSLYVISVLVIGAMLGSALQDF